MEVKDSQQIRPPWLDQKFHRLLTYSKMFNCLKWTKTKVDAKFVGTVMQRMGDLPQCALSGKQRFTKPM